MALISVNIGLQHTVPQYQNRYLDLSVWYCITPRGVAAAVSLFEASMLSKVVLKRFNLSTCLQTLSPKFLCKVSGCHEKSQQRLEVVQQHVRTPSTWVEMACTYSTIDASLIPEIMAVNRNGIFLRWTPKPPTAKPYFVFFTRRKKCIEENRNFCLLAAPLNWATCCWLFPEWLEPGVGAERRRRVRGESLRREASALPSPRESWVGAHSHAGY